MNMNLADEASRTFKWTAKDLLEQWGLIFLACEPKVKPCTLPKCYFDPFPCVICWTAFCFLLGSLLPPWCAACHIQPGFATCGTHATSWPPLFQRVGGQQPYLVIWHPIKVTRQKVDISRRQQAFKSPATVGNWVWGKEGMFWELKDELTDMLGSLPISWLLNNSMARFI